MERAKWEMDQRDWYDYVVVNDKLEDCVNEILNIIAKTAD
jgi:guanylate kinase